MYRVSPCSVPRKLFTSLVLSLIFFLPLQAEWQTIENADFVNGVGLPDADGWTFTSLNESFVLTGTDIHADRRTNGWFSAALYKVFDFTQYSEVKIAYDYKVDLMDGCDILRVDVTLDGGTNLDNQIFYATGYDSHLGSPLANIWHRDTLDLSAYIYYSNVQVVFQYGCSSFQYGDRNGVDLDDIEIFARVPSELTVNTEGQGVVTPTYQAGEQLDTIAITATPDENYDFIGWTSEAGSSTITDPGSTSTTVILGTSTTSEVILATFRGVPYTLTVVDDGRGEVTGGGTVYHGESNPITAIPSTGYGFSTWAVTTGSAKFGDPAADSTGVVLSSGDATVEAQFDTLGYILEVTSAGNGTVNINNDSLVKHFVNTTIIATPGQGYIFKQWNVVAGNPAITLLTSATTTVSLTGDAHIEAEFEPDSYKMTVTNNDGNGNTTPTGASSVVHGVAAAITATGNTGFNFTRWTVTSGSATFDDSLQASTNVTLFSGDATIDAVFSADDYTLTLEGDGNGSTTSDGANGVAHNTPFSITAAPGFGYTFSNWSVESGTATIDDANSATTTVTLAAGDATVRANFVLSTYFPEVTMDFGGIPSSPGAVTHNVLTGLGGTVNNGFNFLYWRVDAGDVTITDSSQQLTTMTVRSAEAKIHGVMEAILYPVVMRAAANGTYIPDDTLWAMYDSLETIIAVPDSGYKLGSWQNWTGTTSFGDINSDTTTLAVQGAAEIFASFLPESYLLTLSTKGIGTTTPTDTITGWFGQFTDIQAHFSGDTTFSHWTVESGDVTFLNNDTTNDNTSIYLGSDAHVTAHFIKEFYTLNIESNDSGYCPNEFTPIQVNNGVGFVVVECWPNEGQRFSHWTVTSGSATIPDSTDMFTPLTLTQEDATILAVFLPQTYTLTVSDTGFSTTIPAGDLTVEHGIAQSIIAEAAIGHEFLGWSVEAGTASIANDSIDTTTVTLTSGDAEVRANFRVLQYLMSVTTNGNGTAEPDGDSIVYHGQGVIVKATCDSLYVFSHWSVTAGTATLEDSLSDSTRASLVGGDATVQAHCILPTFTLTVSDDGNASSTSAGSVDVVLGSTTDVTATANTGYSFQVWRVISGSPAIDDSTSSSATVTMGPGDAEIQAVFSLNVYSVTVQNDGNGNVTPDGAQGVNHGTALELIASPATGYHFLNWEVTAGSAVFSDTTNDTTDVTLTSGDATVRAVFEINVYTVTVETKLGDEPVTSEDIQTNHGDTLSREAEDVQDYVFQNWELISGTGEILDESSMLSDFVFTSDATIRANYDNIVDVMLREGLLPSVFDMKLRGDYLHYDVPPLQGLKPVLVRIAVYNLQGQLITLVKNGKVSPGFHQTLFNRSLGIGSQLYFSNMRAPGYVKTIKVFLK